MDKDFDNMQIGDYVMIATDVDIDDNAKLYYRAEDKWLFISDFSGAQGIQGEQGIQDETLISQLEELLKAQTYSTTTNMSTIGSEVEPIIDIEYYRDLNKVINDLTSKIETKTTTNSNVD